jgi:predicted SAM-dependent methyltransferase
MSPLMERVRQTKAFGSLKQHIDGPLPSYLWLRARGMVHYVTAGHLARRRAIRKYLASTAEPALQVGSGRTELPGWLNSDLLYGEIHLDLCRPLPLPSAAFNYVFSEHVIEHISERQGKQLLRELYRILKPGGVARMTTPDLSKIIAIYEDRNPVVTREAYARFLDNMTGRHHERGCQIFNDYMHLWGHLYVYDEADLVAKMREVGFDAVVRVEPGQSAHPKLRDVEHHGLPWQNDAEAMCVEGTKPVGRSVSRAT